MTSEGRHARTLALKETLRLYSPPGFLLTRLGKIVQVFGDAEEYLKTDSDLFSTNIVELVNDELKRVVAAGLERTSSSDKTTFERIIRLTDETGSHDLLIKIQPLKESAEISTFRLLTLEKSKPDEVVDKSEDNVHSLTDSDLTQILKGRIQKLEASNEELQATNEELTSSNKELLSTKKETSTLYEQIVTDLSEYVVRWRARDGIITYCNPSYAVGVDKTVSDLIGQSIHDVMDNHVNFGETLNKLSAPGEMLHFYTKRIGKDGEENISSGIMRALGDENGQITAYQATGVDVTENHRYQLALESLLQVDERVVDADHNPILEILNIGTRYFQLPCGFVSQFIDDVYHVQHVTNVSNNDDVLQVGDQISLEDSVFTPSSKDKVLVESQIGKSGRRSMKVWRGPSTVSEAINVAATISVRIITSNGEYGTLSFFGSNSLSGKIGEEQILFAKLLSRTVGYQLERSQQLENAMRRRQHYQQLYYQTPVMMCTVDDSTNLLEVNEEFLKKLGYAKNNVIGRSLEEFSPKGLLGDIRANGLIDNGIRKTPIDLLSNHGSVVRTELSAIQITELDSEETSYMLVLEDVTERDAALREVKHQKTELQASNQGLSQFAYIASHDLQEPLRKIRQFGELLDREYAEVLTGDGRYYLDVMTNASERITDLVQDLLDYSRTTNVKLVLKPTDLQQTLKEVLIDLDTHIEESNAQVTSNKLPIVIADSVAVNHLFRNLLSNGIKYQSPGNRPEISVIANCQESKTVIHFSDNGIGIAPDSEQRIYEPFVRLEKRTEYSGSGIGLAICKAVCDRLDWAIAYQSTVGIGTTFSVTIPRKTLSPSATAVGK